MRCCSVFWLVFTTHLAVSTVSWADVITPTGVIATSEWGIEIFAANLIDSSGLLDFEETPDDVLDDLHDNSPTWDNGWHSGDMDAGIPGGTDGDGDLFTTGPVDEQILEFDLGSLFTVQRAHIWQQNQSGLGTFLAPKRGVDEFDILVSQTAAGDTFNSIGAFTLEPEEGIEEVPAQIVPIDPVLARRVRFDINSAHSGEENEFVGLGEVRFEGTPAILLAGDFDSNGDLDDADIDALTEVVKMETNDRLFDVNGDAKVDQQDRRVWVDKLKQTYFGDSNLDGEFNSSDFVVVFQAGHYEDQIVNNSTWGTGDWNGDGEFDSTDFVIAFQAGGYEIGPRDVAAVPEPASILVSFMALASICILRLRE